MKRNPLPYDYWLSVMVAIIVEARPLCCWRNAALAVLSLPELFEGGQYVEGWTIFVSERSIRVLEHGWSMTHDHRIVDPSLILLEEEANSIEYFSGAIYTRDQLQQTIGGAILPLICYAGYGNDGMGHPGYKAAYERAFQHALDKAHELQLDVTAIQILTRQENVLGVTILPQR